MTWPFTEKFRWALSYSSDGHLSSFHLDAILNMAALNILVGIFGEHLKALLWAYTQEWNCWLENGVQLSGYWQSSLCSFDTLTSSVWELRLLHIPTNNWYFLSSSFKHLVNGQWSCENGFEMIITKAVLIISPTLSLYWLSPIHWCGNRVQQG